MNDRELLELAAKAAGYEFSDGRQLNPKKYLIREGDKEWASWNPLTDDGDALRLAVKLKMMIDCVARGNKKDHIAAVSDLTSCREPIQPDPYAATRRAIVRAAAEIGKTI